MLVPQVAAYHWVSAVRGCSVAQTAGVMSDGEGVGKVVGKADERTVSQMLPLSRFECLLELG